MLGWVEAMDRGNENLARTFGLLLTSGSPLPSTLASRPAPSIGKLSGHCSLPGVHDRCLPACCPGMYWEGPNTCELEVNPVLHKARVDEQQSQSRVAALGTAAAA